MAKQSDQVIQLIMSRFDGVDSRLVAQDKVLEKQNQKMDEHAEKLNRVEKQTTITNGRVSALEEINKKKIEQSVQAVLTRRWWMELFVKVAPWVFGPIITILVARWLGS